MAAATDDGLGSWTGCAVCGRPRACGTVSVTELASLVSHQLLRTFASDTGGRRARARGTVQVAFLASVVVHELFRRVTTSAGSGCALTGLAIVITHNAGVGGSQDGR